MHSNRNRVALLSLSCTGTAMLLSLCAGCAQLGNRIVQPVINKAIANGNNLQQQLRKQGEESTPKALQQPVTFPDPNGGMQGLQGSQGSQGFQGMQQGTQGLQSPTGFTSPGN